MLKRRIFLFFAVLFFATTGAFAQDVITLINSDEISAIVQEIGLDDVTYKSNGQIFTKKQSEIHKIVYANGSVDVFNKNIVPKQLPQQATATQTQPQQSQATTTQTNSIYPIFEELGLMIINRELGTGTWYDAKIRCADLNRGGFSDWYLPSKDELEMIFKKGISNDNTPISEFVKGIPSGWYWTSTEIGAKKAYNVSKGGWTSDENKKDKDVNCLCVRKIR